MLKFMACIKTSGKYFKWLLKPVKLGEELEVCVIYKKWPNSFSMWLFHFIFLLVIYENSSCFTLSPGLDLVSFLKKCFKI